MLIGHKFQSQLLALVFDPSFQAIPMPILLFFKLLIEGGAAVIVFFLISGYVITYVFYSDSTVGFLIKRIFRIYPLYIFAVLLQYGLLKMQNPDHEIILPHLIAQLLLLGDFFDTPYSLAGVEWTLRIELLFYILITMIKHWMPKGLDAPWLFPLLFGVVVLAATLPPFPSAPYLFNNYTLLFCPFPLLGSAFYLFETRRVNLMEFLSFIILVFFLFGYMSQYSLSLQKDSFVYYGLLGVGVFALSWKFKENFPANKLIFILSPLTYAIYLFHNWLLDYFKTWSGSMWSELILLMIFCYLAHRYVETPAFNFGKRLAKKGSRYPEGAKE